MRLPVYHKINLLDFSFQSIKDGLLKNSVGKVPIVIEIPGKKKEFAEQILETVHQVIQDLGVHPKLPYPIYLICQEVTSYKDLMIVPRTRDLPFYFNKKIKMLKVREQALLNKTELRTSRILNHSVKEDLALFEAQRKNARYLNHLSFEREALEILQKKMDEAGS